MGTQTQAAGTEAGVLWGRVLLVAAIVLFAWCSFGYIIPSIYGIADEHGYFMTARELATHGTFALHQPDPYAFVGETMMQSPRDAATYYLRQPIGYPVLAAIFYWLAGTDAMFYCNPLLTIVLLCGIYQVGKELRAPLLGAVAALLVGLHPLVIYYATSALSHLPDMAAATWAVAAALMWRREHRGGQAAAVGLLFGAAVLIRYTNVLLLLPLAVVVVEQGRGAVRRKCWGRHVAIAGVALLLMLAPLLVYQSVAFGGPLRTGYSAGGNGTSFSWGWLVAHAPEMSRLVAMPGTGLGVLLLGVLAGVIVLGVKDRFALGVLLTWALPPLVLYTAYYGMPERNPVLYARFTLSSLAPLVLLGVVWVERITWRRAWRVLLVVVLAGGTLAANWLDPFMRKELVAHEGFLLFHFSAESMVRQHAPAGSMIIADTYTYYAVDFAGNYIVYNAVQFTTGGVAARVADLARVPHEFDPARTRQIQQLLGGKSQAELLELLRARVRGYTAQGTPTYLLTSTQRLPMWEELLHARLKELDRNVLDLGLYEILPVDEGAMQLPGGSVSQPAMTLPK